MANALFRVASIEIVRVLAIAIALALPACDLPATETESGKGNDASVDATGPSQLDGATEVSNTDPDGTAPGACADIQGECDIVRQDCPAGKECRVSGSESSYVTVCAPTTIAQRKGVGVTCCPPSTPDQNPCLPGLICSGPPCRGGPAVARCVPHCCEGDDRACGQSPEGYEGRCSLSIVNNANEQLYRLCMFGATCKPFGIQQCPNNEVCRVIDTIGSTTCLSVNGSPLPEGAPCTAGNQCGDDLGCIGPQGNYRCTLLCILPGKTPPFATSGLDGGPGAGGCSPGKACTGHLSDTPDWLGYCQ